MSIVRRLLDNAMKVPMPDAPAFQPPAAAGLPAGALDSAVNGASMLDAWARTDYGRNVLAHALAQLQCDGWLRETPGPLISRKELEARLDATHAEAKRPMESPDA